MAYPSAGDSILERYFHGTRTITTYLTKTTPLRSFSPTKSSKYKLAICRVSTGSKIDFLSNKFIIFGLIKVIYHFLTKTKKKSSFLKKKIFRQFQKISEFFFDFSNFRDEKNQLSTPFFKKNFHQKSYNFISFLNISADCLFQFFCGSHPNLGRSE